MIAKKKYLFAAFGAFACSASAAAAETLSQLSVEEALAACAAVSASDERLECYDKLAAASRPQSPRAAAPESDAAAQQSPAAVAEAQTPAPAPRKDRFVILRADDPKVKALEEPQPKRRDYRNDDEHEARIVAAKKNNIGVLFVELDNGEIWRTLKGSDENLPKRGLKVLMKRNFTGGWLMEIESIDETFKVRRFSLRDN